jgi:dihydrofolate reductase
MLEVVVQTFLTLDGVYQGPGGAEEDTDGGFKHGGWQIPFWDDVGGKIMDQQLAETQALLLGRKTYDIFAGYWPNATEDLTVADKFNSIPKYVASRTMKTADWKGTVVIGTNLMKDVAKAKQAGGTGALAVIGSGNLVQSLMKEGLVDEYRLWIHPIMLGSGKRLFGDGVVPANLKLMNSTSTPSGITLLTYRPEK